MNNHIARLLTDDLRRTGWYMLAFLLAYATFGLAVSELSRGRTMAPLIMGILYFAVVKRQNSQDWTRAALSWPVARRTLGNAQWIAAFGLPLIVMLAAFALYTGLYHVPHGRLRLHPPSFSLTMVWLFLVWGSFGSMLLLEVLGRAAYGGRVSRIVSGGYLMLWCAFWFAATIGDPDGILWRVASNGLLIVAVATAGYTFHHPEILWTSNPRLTPGALRKRNAPAARFTGWGVLWADVLRFGVIGLVFSGVTFAAFMVMAHKPSSLNLVYTGIVIVFPQASSMVPSIRVARTLPLSMSRLTLEIVLLALGRVAFGLLTLAALVTLGIMTWVPSWMMALLISGAVLALASGMRFGPLGGLLLGWGLMMPAILAYDVFHPSDRWITGLLLAAAAITTVSLVWIHRQLRAGHDHYVFGTRN